MRSLEGLIAHVVVCANAVQEGAEPWLSIWSGRLDIDELGFPYGQSVFVFQPRDVLAGRDPAILLPVDADEDVTLSQIGAVELPWRMRSRAQLEENRTET